MVCVVVLVNVMLATLMIEHGACRLDALSLNKDFVHELNTSIMAGHSSETIVFALLWGSPVPPWPSFRSPAETNSGLNYFVQSTIFLHPPSTSRILVSGLGLYILVALAY